MIVISHLVPCNVTPLAFISDWRLWHLRRLWHQYLPTFMASTSTDVYGINIYQHLWHQHLPTFMASTSTKVYDINIYQRLRTFMAYGV